MSSNTSFHAALAALAGLVDEICDAKIDAKISKALGVADEVSSVRLPSDCKSADTFNRACRSGKVRGAHKVGRIWIATADAWRNREAPDRPHGLPLRKPKAPESGRRLSADDDAVRSELGLASGGRR